MKRNNKKNCRMGVAFVFMGVGIVAVTVFPSTWMVAITAVALIAAGVLIMKW